MGREAPGRRPVLRPHRILRPRRRGRVRSRRPSVRGFPLEGIRGDARESWMGVSLVRATASFAWPARAGPASIAVVTPSGFGLTVGLASVSESLEVILDGSRTLAEDDSAPC